MDANSWLLRGGTLVTVDKALPVVRGDLLIIDGIIAAIGAAASSDPRSVGVPVLDMSGCVVLPGLVQAHIHLCQTLGRGLADDLPLLRWLSAVSYTHLSFDATRLVFDPERLDALTDKVVGELFLAVGKAGPGLAFHQ